MNSNYQIGLYIHIPFCNQICPYCDFYKMVVSDKLQTEYIDAVIKEMQLKKIECIAFDTIYFGGGTPSSLSYYNLERLLCYLNQTFDFCKIKEITFECNPSDINEPLLKILKKYHISRLSIGIQTLNTEFQKLIKRFTSIDDMKKIVSLLHKFNFDNYNFDLIYGFYGQTIIDLKKDIDLLMQFKPKHLSIYALMIESKTYFKKLVDEGIKIDASDEEQAKMYHFIISYLKSFGLYQYETSNFSIPGYESKHNLLYWDHNEYYSLGAGASSYVDHCRYVMTRKINDYIFNINNGTLLQDVEKLSLNEEIDEYVMMNLRKKSGLNLDDFKQRYGVDIFLYYPSLKNLIYKEKLINLVENQLMIKQKYFYVANYIIVKIIASR